jgi:hypothetical protein
MLKALDSISTLSNRKTASGSGLAAETRVVYTPVSRGANEPVAWL